jgi:hypothetical protein
LYDFTCYGPHRFHRRFVGTIRTNCNQLEIVSSIDPNGGGVALTMQNFTATPTTFTITNADGLGGLWSYPVPPGNLITRILSITNTVQAYRLTASANTDTQFFREFAGDIDSVVAPAVPIVPQVISLLAARVSGAGLVLTFPPSVGGLTLESTTDLGLNTWTAVTATRVTNGSVSVTLPITNQFRFFRLRP